MVVGERKMGASRREFGASQAGALPCPPASLARGPCGLCHLVSTQVQRDPEVLVLGAISFPEDPCVSHALLQKKWFYCCDQMLL